MSEPLNGAEAVLVFFGNLVVHFVRDFDRMVLINERLLEVQLA